MRRALLVVLTMLALLGVSTGPAAAIDLPIPLPTPGCGKGDPPTPASPYGDGSWIVRLSSAEALIQGGHQVAGAEQSAADPFTDPTVSFESTYGVTPQWWAYDNGCVGGIFAGIGSGLGNIGLQLSGILPNWTEALIDAVISPGDWIGVLDEPVARSTQAIAEGVWTPWLVVVLALVAVLVMFRARGGHLSGSVTATAWALLVLITVSWLIEYPTESVRLVDAGVRTAVVGIATGFNEADEAAATATDTAAPAAGTDEERALQAVDQQMDAIVRHTQYRTWAAGVFGDPDSKTAEQYGPAVFRATHFTWAEYDAYRADPTGKGKVILEEKQSQFEALASSIENEDPVAYRYFTGSQWGQRLALVVMNAIVLVIVCGFLLMSGLAILFSFALIRLVVPFSPAAGVLFMLDNVRDLAVGTLRRIVGPLVMGPVYFLVGLLLVRFEGQVLTSEMWFVVKLGLIAVLSWMAWRLTRPAAYGLRVPGLRGAVQFASSFLGTKAGVAAGTREPEYADGPARTRVRSERVVHVEEQRTDLGGPVPAVLPSGRQVAEEAPDESFDGPARHATPVRATRSEPMILAPLALDNEEPSAPSRRVDEANLSYDEFGAPVFVLYDPKGELMVPADDRSWTTGVA